MGGPCRVDEVWKFPALQAPKAREEHGRCSQSHRGRAHPHTRVLLFSVKSLRAGGTTLLFLLLFLNERVGDVSRFTAAQHLPGQLISTLRGPLAPELTC